MSGLSRRHLLFSGVSLAPVLLAYKLNAQESAEVAAGNAAQDPGIAMELLITGRKQIKVCQLAIAQLSKPETKQFAQLEIEEHEEMKKQLAALGFDYITADENASATQDAGKIGPAKFMVQHKQLPDYLVNQLQICHEVAEQCIATQAAELGKLKENYVDRRFIENQLDAHYALFDHAVIFSRHTTPELSKTIENARPTIEKHIAMCKAIREKLS